MRQACFLEKTTSKRITISKNLLFLVNEQTGRILYTKQLFDLLLYSLISGRLPWRTGRLAYVISALSHPCGDYDNSSNSASIITHNIVSFD